MNSSIGKISRLPHHIRETVHARLRDGEQGRQIVAWLNSLPEVQQVLAASFGGRPITQSNLSEWKKRSHRDWLLHQDAMANLPGLVAQSRELSQAGQGRITDHLVTVLAGHYAVATLMMRGDTDAARKWKRLRALCQDVSALRRGDQAAERMRLQRLEMTLKLPKITLPKLSSLPPK
ncbi:MAG: hypothetical protein ABSA47_03405 [Verrucomicrobiota bacterium]|jgi:hypothetical protein